MSFSDSLVMLYKIPLWRVYQSELMTQSELASRQILKYHAVLSDRAYTDS